VGPPWSVWQLETSLDSRDFLGRPFGQPGRLQELGVVRLGPDSTRKTPLDSRVFRKAVWCAVKRLRSLCAHCLDAMLHRLSQCHGSVIIG